MTYLNNLTMLAMNASLMAGDKIIEVYNSDDFNVEIKEDNSPLTKADIASNNSIKEGLKNSHIPVLSEEGSEISYKERSKWKKFWLVDPLDGTKEFINQYPIAGVIYVPCTGELYFANKIEGSFKYSIKSGKKVFKSFSELKKISDKLPLFQSTSKYTVVGSRSHISDETLAFIQTIKSKHGEIEIVSKGSALKLCLIAEGKADIYPRFGPTMEWDTAAGHAIVKFSGANIYHTDNPSELKYNKENLLNPYFIAERKRSADF